MNAPRLPATSLARALGQWRGNGPLHRDLGDRLRLLILDGRIPLGSGLPSERALATTLGLSRTTVTAAYEALRESDHASSRQGSGTLVQLPGPALSPGSPHGSEGLIDLGRASLPASELVAPALRAAAEELPGFLHDTGYDVRGLPHLRQQIADDYTRRGLPTGSEQITVTLGSQHAIHLLAHLLISPGDRVLVESPSYPHALEALAAAGARLVGTPVTGTPGTGAPHASQVPDDGWDLPALEGTLAASKPALAYLMPELHNPTGSTMGAPNRARLLNEAKRHGTTLIIDETTAGLRTDGLPAGPPLGAGTPPRQLPELVHLGSTGKLFWGGLRVGWIRAQAPLVERIVAARSVLDLGTPVVEQLATAHLLRQQAQAGMERAAQLNASAVVARALAAEHLPGWGIPEYTGGLALWCHLPSPLASALSLAARTEGVLLPPGARFGIGAAAFESFVRLPVTSTPAELERAIPAIGRAWASVLEPQRGRRERQRDVPLV